MKPRIAAAAIALAAALTIPAIPAAADETAVPTPSTSSPATLGDLGWGKASPDNTPSPTPTPTPPAQTEADLGWG